MNDNTGEFQLLIDRLRAGDAAAKRLLLERVCGRLQRLASHILNASFPAVRARHDRDSIVHETWLRLAQALESVELTSAEHFFRLAAQKVRQVLLDMVDRQRRRDGREAEAEFEPAQQTYDPARLAAWTEFHDRVARLADDERAVFEMHYYLEMPQAEVATVLNLHPRKVSRLWVAATERLGEGLDESLA